MLKNQNGHHLRRPLHSATILTLLQAGCDLEYADYDVSNDSSSRITQISSELILLHIAVESHNVLGRNYVKSNYLAFQ